MTEIMISGNTYRHKAFLGKAGFCWNRGKKVWTKTVDGEPGDDGKAFAKLHGVNLKGCRVSAFIGGRCVTLWTSREYVAPQPNAIGGGIDEYGTTFGDHDYL